MCVSVSDAQIVPTPPPLLLLLLIWLRLVVMIVIVTPADTGPLNPYW